MTPTQLYQEVLSPLGLSAIHPLHRAALEEACENAVNNPQGVTDPATLRLAALVAFATSLTNLRALLVSLFDQLDADQATIHYRGRQYVIPRDSALVAQPLPTIPNVPGFENKPDPALLLPLTLTEWFQRHPKAHARMRTAILGGVKASNYQPGRVRDLIDKLRRDELRRVLNVGPQGYDALLELLEQDGLIRRTPNGGGVEINV